MLTMVIGGLWHGADWTFVAWGVYHGLLLRRLPALRAARGIACPRLAQRAGTFLLVLLGWVAFRATSFAQCGTHPAPDVLRPWRHATQIAAALRRADGGGAGLGCLGTERVRLPPELATDPASPVGAAPRSSGVCLAVIVGNRNSPFLYFQF